MRCLVCVSVRGGCEQWMLRRGKSTGATGAAGAAGVQEQVSARGEPCVGRRFGLRRVVASLGRDAECTGVESNVQVCCRGQPGAQREALGVETVGWTVTTVRKRGVCPSASCKRHSERRRGRVAAMAYPETETGVRRRSVSVRFGLLGSGSGFGSGYC